MNSPIRLLVCGGRGFRDWDLLSRTLANIRAAEPIARIIHGGADGADRLADRWAVENGVPVSLYLPDWDNLGRAAGPRRNQYMLDDGKPHRVIAFQGGRGTADMIRRAKKAGVPVIEVKT